MLVKVTHQKILEKMLLYKLHKRICDIFKLENAIVGTQLTGYFLNIYSKKLGWSKKMFKDIHICLMQQKYEESKVE